MLWDWEGVLILCLVGKFSPLNLLQVVEVAPSELEDLALYSKYSVKDNNNKNTGLQTREA